MNTRDRFWSHVDQSAGPDGCWRWTGAIDKAGYGNVMSAGKSARAHRVAWTLANGPIPPGDHHGTTCVLHRCDNPPCCNPAHLFLGTHAQNMADRDSKGRTAKGDRQGTHTHPESVARGESHRAAKLCAADVLAIRQRVSRGERQAIVARDYGVTRQLVSRIVLGIAWASVTGGPA